MSWKHQRPKFFQKNSAMYYHIHQTLFLPYCKFSCAKNQSYPSRCPRPKFIERGPVANWVGGINWIVSLLNPGIGCMILRNFEKKHKTMFHLNISTVLSPKPLAWFLPSSSQSIRNAFKSWFDLGKVWFYPLMNTFSIRFFVKSVENFVSFPYSYLYFSVTTLFLPSSLNRKFLTWRIVLISSFWTNYSSGIWLPQTSRKNL